MIVENRFNRRKFISARRQSKKSSCPVLKKRTRNYREERDLQLVERRNFVEFETRIHQCGVTRWLAFAVARVLRESGRADTVSPS